MCPDKEDCKLIHSNRSMACCKCHKYKEALREANQAISCGPEWSKGYWRKGTALLSLGDGVLAVDAFYQSWRLEKSVECTKKLTQVIDNLPKEQLALKIVQLLEEVENDGLIQAVQVEIAETIELQEGLFNVIVSESKGKRELHELYAKYKVWRMHGFDSIEAYILRSKVYCAANCFLQAREDAQGALDIIMEQANALEMGSKDKGNYAAQRSILMDSSCRAYISLGYAYTADPNHPDRDSFAAVKALTKAMDCGCSEQSVRDQLQNVSEDLTKEQMDRVRIQIEEEGNVMQNDPENSLNSLCTIQVTLAYPQASPRDLTPVVRESIRASLAFAFKVKMHQATIEKVNVAKPIRITLNISVESQQNISQEDARDRVIKQLVPPASGEWDTAISNSLGMLDENSIYVSLQNRNPSDKAFKIRQDGPVSPSPEERRLTVPSRPKNELAVPYRSYSLVDAYGKAVARTEKHAFCMSRVYYDRAEIQQEVWVELADGSCRWRQTGSEIKIIALQVPPKEPPKNITVDFQPYYLTIKNKVTDETYLEGHLFRGIIPDACFWTHLGGDGEDGFLISLTKMNLEVLKRHWMHSEMWWSKLFNDHPDIAWDDYEKDYSDLPEEVLEKHRLREAIKDSEKQVEQGDEKRRDRIQAAEDMRKRKRQERLQVLRDGAHQ